MINQLWPKNYYLYLAFSLCIYIFIYKAISNSIKIDDINIK